MHDAAIAAWGVKGYYDYVRPISAIRYMADRGQSSHPDRLSYHPHGLPFQRGLIEVIIAIRTWSGHVEDPDSQYAGVEWILAREWWPYQRPSFVTPPFAGYVSGHSTFSRGAAEVMTLLTGTEFFPGGLGSYKTLRDEFLVFEEGPSEDVTLQWATYFDAADECSRSRIYAGIHPTADDIPGRFMGAILGPDAFDKAQEHFAGFVTPNVFSTASSEAICRTGPTRQAIWRSQERSDTPFIHKRDLAKPGAKRHTVHSQTRPGNSRSVPTPRSLSNAIWQSQERSDTRGVGAGFVSLLTNQPRRRTTPSPKRSRSFHHDGGSESGGLRGK